MLAFNIYWAYRGDFKPRELRLYWSPNRENEAKDTKRMLGAWADRWTVRLMGAAGPAEFLQGDATDRCNLAYLADNERELATLGLKFAAPTRLANVPPPPGSEAADFWAEVVHHDSAIGGVTDWNKTDNPFAAKILQSLSVVNSVRDFPQYLSDFIAKAHRVHGRPVQALDIGCGPISALRWGALQGLVDIVGVDPLNELYSAILEKHGLAGLPEIHPRSRVSGYAETVILPDTMFDLVYSRNALDHTQDLVAAFRNINKLVRPGGLVSIGVNVREGERQNYHGLHKFNMWMEEDKVMYSQREAAPRDLLQEIDGLRIDNIVNYSEKWMTFNLIKK